MAQGPEESAVGRQVEELLAALHIERATQEQVAAAAQELVGMGREAVGRLARGILRSGRGRREKVAALLGCLDGEPATWAFNELQRLVGSRPLNATERLWLMTTLQRLAEAAAPPTARKEPPPDEPAARGSRSSLAAAVANANEEDLLAWREELASVDPEQREAVLANVLDSRDPAVLPLLEMVLSLEEPGIDALVAEGLAGFATPAVLPLLGELLRRPDAEVRRRVRKTLLALESQGVDTRGIFAAAAESDEAGAQALATMPDDAGQMIVVVARGRGPGRVRYALVGIDPIEEGIVNCWGESGLTDSEFRGRMDDMSERTSMDLYPMDLNLAQALVAAAAEYARQQGRELPPDYAACRRVVGRPTAPAALPFDFGPACAECGQRLRMADMDEGGLVGGELAICARCAERPRRCRACGRRLEVAFDEFQMRRAAPGGEVEFLCLACVGRGRKKRRRKR